MAGHNKWSKIKHRKKVVDSRRSKVWSKCSRAIIVAARNGGPDPDANLALRYAIDEARWANMPRDTIERAIKKGSGDLGTENYENVRYEGYGPSGVAVVVDTLTNNRTRTAGDLRKAFEKAGGNLGTTGCVAYLFETRGTIEARAGSMNEDAVMEAAINAGASDATPPPPRDDDDDDDDEDDEDRGPAWTIATAPGDLHAVKTALEAAGLKIATARIELVPTTTVSVRGDAAKGSMALVEALEDNDDVQKVYANFEIPDDELAALEGE
jgi:YebC/PmpR family DNA-binding regulatory protein